MTPRNTAGPTQLSEEDVLERAFALRLPDSPNHEPWYFGGQTPQTVISLNSSEEVPFYIRDRKIELARRMLLRVEAFDGDDANIHPELHSPIHPTPLESPVSSVHTTPVQSPVNSVHTTPIQSPVNSVHTTPIQSPVSSKSSLGLETYFPVRAQSVVERVASSVSEIAPLNTQTSIQGSPVLSQVNLEPGFFSISGSRLSDFPSGSRHFQGWFGSLGNSPRGSVK
uniref:Uncharacterized protein n=1 Tax=Inonotus obliquus TaxID=167356 RepID=A0A5A4UDG2_9AGAM|nr:hypothetical protein [Inonotus obliquus]BBN21281.1 hypothetical protein [Inonotus obliquus]